MEIVLDANRHGELNQVDQALLVYAGKLTRTPQAMTSEDVAKLRETGLSERAILDACQIASYFNFINRMADGLGVELEPQYRKK